MFSREIRYLLSSGAAVCETSALKITRSARLTMACALVLIGVGCAPEKNPYADRYQTAGTSSPNAANGTPTKQNIPAGAKVDTEQAAKDVATAAKTEDIAKATLTGVQVICSSSGQAGLAKAQAELAVICVNGQPTQAFANALKTPYKGGANPPLQLIKSVDVDRVSEFLVLAVIEVPKPVADVYAKRAELVSGTTTATSASITQTVLVNNPAVGDTNLGHMEVQFDLAVQVGGITVDNTSILTGDLFPLTPDKSVIASFGALKAGDPENEDDILANSLTFFMQDGTNTKIISVNHQMANNRGRHPTAEATVLSLGAATMTGTYDKLTK